MDFQLGRDYDIYEEGLNEFHKLNGEDTQIDDVFRCLKDQEKKSNEVSEKLEIDRPSVSSSLSMLEKEGFAYIMLSDSSGFYWCLDADELYED